MSNTYSEDIQALECKTWKQYRQLSKYPVNFMPTCDLVLSLITLLNGIHGAVTEKELSIAETTTLQDLLKSCRIVLSSLASALSYVRLHQGDYEALIPVQIELKSLTEELSKFLALMRSHTQEKLFISLTHIRSSQNHDFQKRVETDWEFLTTELVKFKLTEALINEEFFSIKNWFQDHPYEAAANTALSSGDARAKFEGSDGLILQSPEQIARHSINRKHVNRHSPQPSFSLPAAIQSEEKTPNSKSIVTTRPDLDNGLMVRTASTLDKVLILKSSEQKFVDGLILQSPYTAQEHKPDGLIQPSDEFEEFVKAAITAETDRLQIENERFPDACPRPYMWLPKDLQAEYRGTNARNIVSNMDQSSFSVMAHQTTPKLKTDIQRLRYLLDSSFATGTLGSNDGVVADAFRCLETMSLALPKFDFLHNLNSTVLNDLDVLDLQCSTIDMANSTSLFPIHELEMARTAYWKLLTHLLGLASAVSNIFKGRTYITRSRSELSFLWDFNGMNTQTAHLEVQLAEWDAVENAVRFCRHWHSQALSLMDQAVERLEGWQKVLRILNGKTEESFPEVEFTLIGANNLPKHTFLKPGTIASIIIPRRMVHEREQARQDVVTDEAPPGLEATWNKSISIHVSSSLQFIHIVLAQRDMKIARQRLSFHFPNIGPSTFLNRNLMEDINEVMTVAMPHDEETNKKKGPITLTVALKWKGFHTRMSEYGISTTPPGKMFKREVPDMPRRKDELPSY